MELTELGLDSGLAAQAQCAAGLRLARVTAVDRNRYVVRNERGEVPAELTGRFLHAAASSVDLPCVGDWVCVQYHDADSHATIHDLVPRRSFLRRKSGTGEGRHTTTRRHLVVLDNGALLIDMPGMRELGIMSEGSSLNDSFAEIGELAARCRFSDCTHNNEPGCAIRKAIERGELDAAHYQSYLKLKAESEFNEMSYLDKRKKDKAFGKMVKSVLKERQK